jgi:hypothetical protein
MKLKQACEVFGMRALVLSACGLVGLSLGRAEGAILWDESSQGDLSNSQAAPTPFAFAPGVNSIIGTVGPGDSQDWITFSIPAGLQLSAVTPATYVSADSTAFNGIQGGSTFVGSPGVESSYLGYTHIGPGVVGANILPSMGAASGAQGFTPPLPAGDYTYLIQQLGAVTTYRLDFTAVPEPRAQALAAGLLAGGFFLWNRRARRSRG